MPFKPITMSAYFGLYLSPYCFFIIAELDMLPICCEDVRTSIRFHFFAAISVHIANATVKKLLEEDWSLSFKAMG